MKSVTRKQELIWCEKFDFSMNRMEQVRFHNFFGVYFCRTGQSQRFRRAAHMLKSCVAPRRMNIQKYTSNRCDFDYETNECRIKIYYSNNFFAFAFIWSKYMYVCNSSNKCQNIFDVWHYVHKISFLQRKLVIA